MERVLIRIPKGGSLEVSGDGVTPEIVHKWISSHLNGVEIDVGVVASVERIKRGPKKRVVPASGDSEVENHD